MPKEFHNETRNLLFILITFFLTYFTRYISDYFFIPQLNDVDEVGPCLYYETKTVCSSFTLVMYYTWSELIWDFLPVFLLIWFHHRNFRPKKHTIDETVEDLFQMNSEV